jgi:cytochrome c-type biogenesis protein CcmF
MLAALVTFTVASEFIRGGRVIASHTGQNLVLSMVQLWHRNTRRYGGYIVHLGVAMVVIGILGTPFNREAEKEMGYGDQLNIGQYTLVCRSYTQDDKPNYASEWAVVDVYKKGQVGGAPLETMYPERRFYKASQQAQTMPQIHPHFTNPFVVSDLYLVYEGLNQDTGRPIIKAHLNPMVPSIWLGLLVMVFGTLIALVPNAEAVSARLPARVQAAPVGVGD